MINMCLGEFSEAERFSTHFNRTVKVLKVHVFFCNLSSFSFLPFFLEEKEDSYPLLHYSQKNLHSRVLNDYLIILTILFHLMSPFTWSRTNIQVISKESLSSHYYENHMMSNNKGIHVPLPSLCLKAQHAFRLFKAFESSVGNWEGSFHPHLWEVEPTPLGSLSLSHRPNDGRPKHLSFIACNTLGLSFVWPKKRTYIFLVVNCQWLIPKGGWEKRQKWSWNCAP